MTDRPTVPLELSDRDYVYAIALRVVRSPADADDVTQDTLLLAFRYRDGFRGEACYRTWLYRIAYTTALRHLRRKQRTVEHRERGIADPAPETPPSIVDDLVRRETIARVREAVDRLPPIYRDVLRVRATATEQQVAAQLGITLGNVKVRGHRARARLKRTLGLLVAR